MHLFEKDQIIIRILERTLNSTVPALNYSSLRNTVTAEHLLYTVREELTYTTTFSLEDQKAEGVKSRVVRKTESDNTHETYPFSTKMKIDLKLL